MNDQPATQLYWIGILVALVNLPVEATEKAKIVFISGKPSHGPMQHEHRAGNMILATALNDSGLEVQAVVVPHYGYPEDTSLLDDAATIVVFSTGHGGLHLSDQ